LIFVKATRINTLPAHQPFLAVVLPHIGSTREVVRRSVPPDLLPTL
jgi:hypothetical protein